MYSTAFFNPGQTVRIRNILCRGGLWSGSSAFTPAPPSFIQALAYNGDTNTSSSSFPRPPPSPFPELSSPRATPFPSLPPSAPDPAHGVPPQAAEPELQAAQLNQNKGKKAAAVVAFPSSSLLSQGFPDLRGGFEVLTTADITRTPHTPIFCSKWKLSAWSIPLFVELKGKSIQGRKILLRP